jgi:hypothetical protein
MLDAIVEPRSRVSPLPGQPGPASGPHLDHAGEGVVYRARLACARCASDR